jgi:hypothetical protein
MDKKGGRFGDEICFVTKAKQHDQLDLTSSPARR